MSPSEYFQLRRVGAASTLQSVLNVFRLSEGNNIIGRNPTVVDFFINSAVHKKLISREHAVICVEKLHRDDNEYTITITDKSINGTFVNDQKIVGSVPLRDGSTITFGHLKGVKICPWEISPQTDSEFRFKFEKVDFTKECHRANESLKKTCRERRPFVYLENIEHQTDDSISNLKDIHKVHHNPTKLPCNRYDCTIVQKGINIHSTATQANKDKTLPGCSNLPASSESESGCQSLLSKCTLNTDKNNEDTSTNGSPVLLTSPVKDSKVKTIVANIEKITREHSNIPSQTCFPLIKENVTQDSSQSKENCTPSTAGELNGSNFKSETTGGLIFSEDESDEDLFVLTKNIKTKVLNLVQNSEDDNDSFSLSLHSPEKEEIPFLSQREDKDLSDLTSRYGVGRGSCPSPELVVGCTTPKKRTSFPVEQKAKALCKKKVLAKKRKSDGSLPSAKRTALDDEACSATACKLPTGLQVTWVQCDDCDLWYHTECAGCSYKVVRKSSTSFHCGCVK